MRSFGRIERELGLPSSGGFSTSRVIGQDRRDPGQTPRLICVPAGAEKDFLAPLAVEMIPGVGPKTHQDLLQRGIKTIGDLLQMPNWPRAISISDESSARHHHHDHSIGNETTLDTPLKTIAEMEEVLWQLVEEVGGRLRSEEYFARCLTVKIRYSEFSNHHPLAHPDSPDLLRQRNLRSCQRLAAAECRPGRAVRLLGVSASALQTSGWQEPLLDREQRKSMEQLYQGIDELRRKYGEDAIGAATPRKRSG